MVPHKLHRSILRDDDRQAFWIASTKPVHRTVPSPDVVERFVGPDFALQIECVSDAFQAGRVEAQLGAEPNQVEGLGDHQGPIHRHQICQKMREIEQSLIHIA